MKLITLFGGIKYFFNEKDGITWEYSLLDAIWLSFSNAFFVLLYFPLQDSGIDENRL